MKTITLGQWLDGEDCPAFIDGSQIQSVTFQDGTRYDGIPRVYFEDGSGDYVQLADRFVLVQVEDDSERTAREAEEAAAAAAFDVDDEPDRLARETHALEMLEADAEREANEGYTCDYCGENIGASPFNRCPTCGAGGLEGGGSDDDPQPLTDAKAGQAWGVIDGQTIDEAVVRRLIGQKMDALEKLRVTQFALNHAIQLITRLENELGGCKVSVFSMTPKGYDSIREMGYDDGQPSVGA